MYGTVARMRPKAGQEQALVNIMKEFERDRKPKVKGFVASYVYKSEKSPGDLIMAVVFQDHDSYHANADDPEQDRWYRRFRELLEADPVWEDGEIISAS
ncbi:MAG: Antibiotic biosynthesis monooxygenase [Dehalococcoidia bacterium]|nr:Antibiotic biosynthesis monooxygenase [Dehalococcoidia bacterium]